MKPFTSGVEGDPGPGQAVAMAAVRGSCGSREEMLGGTGSKVGSALTGGKAQEGIPGL